METRARSGEVELGLGSRLRPGLGLEGVELGEPARVAHEGAAAVDAGSGYGRVGVRVRVRVRVRV